MNGEGKIQQVFRSKMTLTNLWPSWWLSGKESDCNAGDPDSIPGSGRSPGEGNGNPFQYACLENSMDRGAWRATVHVVIESDMTERLTHTTNL